MSLFSARLKNLRKTKGENQETVASFLGVQRTTYSGYERGVIVPPYEKIQKLADRYNVSVDYLMGQSNFENYELKVAPIPDIAVQLKMISDELMSETSAIDCNGIRLGENEKKELLPFVNSCIKMLNIMTQYKERK